MGYRSDVAIAFYTLNIEQLPFASIKLWFDENFLVDGCWVPDRMDTNAESGSIVVYYDSVKWYESYPEVKHVNQALKLFTTTFDCDESSTHAAWEQVRVGEEINDTDHEGSDYQDYRLGVSREIYFN